MSKVRKDDRGRILRVGEVQRENGLYMYRYNSLDGERHTIYDCDLLNLRQKEMRLNNDSFEGINSYKAGHTSLNFSFDRYIETKYNLREQTRAGYKYYYDHFLRKGLGRRMISDIKYSDIKIFYISLLKDRKLSISTLSDIQCFLHPTFQMACRDGVIRNNPCQGVIKDIVGSFGCKKGVRHALTYDQQKEFMEYVASSPIYCHWLNLFTVMFGTGMRIGEVIGLRWEDLDFENNSINVNHCLIYAYMENGHSEFHVSKTKTDAGIRVIPMLSAVKSAFLNEKKIQLETGMNSTVVDGMSGFVFQNRSGALCNPSTVNRAIQRIYEAHNAEAAEKEMRDHRKAVMIPSFSCHVIRHTFCTRLCEHENNLKVIQSIMGHADIQTTMNIYAEATKERNNEAMVSLEHAVNIF